MTLRVAFAEADVTPEPGRLLAGMPWEEAGEGEHWPLHGRVAVFDDAETRIALVALDALALEPATALVWREALAVAAGLSAHQVLISCTHTHRAPCTVPAIGGTRDDEYLDFALARLVDAAAAAADRLEVAELRIGRVDVPGWSFNRRPLYRSGEVGTHGPEWVEDFVRFEGGADSELQVLSALRASDRAPLGGLVNFACHPTVVAFDPVYSADFPGPLTEALAKRHGGTFAFLQGASGDVSPEDMSAPGRAQHGFQRAETMGHALADAADLAIASAQPVSDPRLSSAVETLEIEQRQPSPEQVRLARWYLEERVGQIDERAFTEEIYGHSYTFYEDLPEIQPWFARDTIALWETQRLSGMRVPSESVEVQALAIGDVAFVAYPAEMFDEFGVGTKARSPFPTTLVCSLANGWHGYVPTKLAFKHGGYEPRLASSSRLAPDAGDRMVAAGLRLLEKLRDCQGADRDQVRRKFEA
jgi:neutral ceramidase